MQKVRLVAGEHTQQSVKKNSSDTSETLSTKGVTIALSNAREAVFAIITVEANVIRHGFGTVTPSLGHIADPGDRIKLEGEREIKDWECISETPGSHADLMISVEY